MPDKKIPIVSTDQDFIDIVKQLEVIKLDLEVYGHIEEIANTLVIRDIESRLPTTITNDWASIIVRELLEDSTSLTMFQRLMKFLSSEKD